MGASKGETRRSLLGCPLSHPYTHAGLQIWADLCLCHACLTTACLGQGLGFVYIMGAIHCLGIHLCVRETDLFASKHSAVKKSITSKKIQMGWP